MDLLPSCCPSQLPAPRSQWPCDPNAAALWSGCGRSQKNASYYCLFLPGSSPPLPANKAFPIAEHTSMASLPSSRTPGPSSILVALPRPIPPTLVLHQALSHPVSRLPRQTQWGHPSFLLLRASKDLLKMVALMVLKLGTVDRCCGNDLDVLGHPSHSRIQLPWGWEGTSLRRQGASWHFASGSDHAIGDVQSWGYCSVLARPCASCGCWDAGDRAVPTVGGRALPAPCGMRKHRFPFCQSVAVL